MAMTDFSKLKYGDKVGIELKGLGTFNATVVGDAPYRVRIMFDDYIAKRPMNEVDTNNGGFEASDLKKWLNTELFDAFPQDFKEHMDEITIPSIGDLTGWHDIKDTTGIETDDDTIIPLMYSTRNRLAFYKNYFAVGWLRNAITISSMSFASIDPDTSILEARASCKHGVRPEFWLNTERQKKQKASNVLKDICNFYGLTYGEMAKRMLCSNTTMTAKMCQFRRMTVDDLVTLVWNFGYPGSYVTYENVEEDICLHVHIEADDNNIMLQTFDKRYICTPGKLLREID
jgi:hypothetical protein